MYKVKQAFVVQAVTLECVINGAPRRVSQGSWVPEGATIDKLTDKEQEVYGIYLVEPAKKTPKPPKEDEGDAE